MRSEQRSFNFDYASPEEFVDEAEQAVVVQWLNGLGIKGRVDLAARLLSFSMDDAKKHGGYQGDALSILLGKAIRPTKVVQRFLEDR